MPITVDEIGDFMVRTDRHVSRVLVDLAREQAAHAETKKQLEAAQAELEKRTQATAEGQAVDKDGPRASTAKVRSIAGEAAGGEPAKAAGTGPS